MDESFLLRPFRDYVFLKTFLVGLPFNGIRILLMKTSLFPEFQHFICSSLSNQGIGCTQFGSCGDGHSL